MSRVNLATKQKTSHNSETTKRKKFKTSTILGYSKMELKTKIIISMIIRLMHYSPPS
jgi:hypothetical protein